MSRTWEEIKKYLNEKAPKLLQPLSVALDKPRIQLQLVKNDVVQDADMVTLQDIPNTQQRVVKFLTLLKAGSTEKYDAFVKVMKENKESAVVNCLEGGRSCGQQRAAGAKRHSGKDIPLWHPKHPKGGDLLFQTDLSRNLEIALPNLNKMNPDDLWASLIGYGVIRGTNLERCQAAGIHARQVEELVKYLQQDVVWKTHGFLKALSDIGKGIYIDQVLGKGASSLYADPKDIDEEQIGDDTDLAGATGEESSSTAQSRGLQFLDSQDYEWIEKRYKELQKLSSGAGAPMKVAVVDSMVNRKHLPDVEIVNCGPTLPDRYVEDTHGTNCAAIIRKCAPGVGIVSYNVTDYDKKEKQWPLKNSLIINALKQIEDRVDIAIVSMSYGSPVCDEEEAKILQRMSTNKVLIAAASNEGWREANTIQYPAKLPYVIAVGSCDENGEKVGHSSVGEELDFLMPGLDIKVANIMKKGGTGTSYAGPHMAAAAALILKAIESTQDAGPQTRQRLTTTEDMRQLLKRACKGYGPHTIHRGHGLPNLNLVNKEFLKDYIYNPDFEELLIDFLTDI